MTFQLRMHKTSQVNIETMLATVKELKQGKKTGKQIASVLNKHGVVVETGQALNGRRITYYDIPVCVKMLTDLDPSNEVLKHNRGTHGKRRPKVFNADPFKMVQDVMSSNLDENTQRYLVALLSKNIK